MNRKQFAVATLFATVLLTAVIVPMSTQQGGGAYDPWLDYNEDGKISVDDLHQLGGAYGTTGDATKNVNVTNWPQSNSPLFTEYLYLRAQASPSDFTLVDENMQYVPYIWQSDGTSLYLEPSIWTLVYSRPFIYEKMPVRAYQILGRPTISLTFNFTTSDSATVFVMYNVTMWKLLPNSSEELLCTFPNYQEILTGTLTDYQLGKSFSTQEWINATIVENQRLLLRVKLYAFLFSSPGVTLLSELVFKKNTDDFRLDIPIVTDP